MRLGANPGAATGIRQSVTVHPLGNARVKTERCSGHIVVTKLPNETEPLAGASIADSGNHLMKSNVRIATASGWLQRLVRCPPILKCASDVSMMKHSQNKSRRYEKRHKRANTNQETETWM
jgi:hypothetical protein